MTDVFTRGTRVRLWGTFWVNQTTLALSAAAGALTITVQDATGYANADPVVLAPGTAKQELLTVSGTPTAAGVITLAAALRYAHSVGEVVGELTTPSAHKIRTRDPSGTETDRTTSVASVGRVYFDLDIPNTSAAEGTWHYDPAGTAGVLATDPRSFVVADSPFD